MSHASLVDGRCGHCRTRHHCHGRVGACRCDCTGAPVDAAPSGAFVGARGVVGGTAYAWCDRCDGYHLASARTRGATLRTGRARLRWSSRIGAPTPFRDADNGRVVVGAVTRDLPTPTLSAVQARAARLHADADASRDRHGATPSAFPSIAPRARDASNDVTPHAAATMRRMARMTTPDERAAARDERAAWRAAFNARLASRDAR